MLTKFLDPKNDVAFRKIFGTEKNKEILIHFLNDVIEFERGPIQEVSFLKTVQDPEVKAHKTSIVDILCEDEKGNRYIVEMQVAKEKGFEKRAQYYASKAYCSQMMEGGKYYTLKAIIFLAITDFVMFPQKQHYKSDHIILDKTTYENDLKDFSYTFLELPKFTKGVNELRNMTEMWMYFFKHAEETSPEDLEKLAGYEEIIAKAYGALDRFFWKQEEILAYDQSEKYEGAYLASMEQKFDEGEAKGRAEGERIGIKKIALRQLQQGYSIEEIENITGLTQQEILDISKNQETQSYSRLNLD